MADFEERLTRTDAEAILRATVGAGWWRGRHEDCITLAEDSLREYTADELATYRTQTPEMFAQEHGITKELLETIQAPFQFQGNIEYMQFKASLRRSRPEDATQAQNTGGAASSVSEGQERPRFGRMAMVISDVLGDPHNFPEYPFELRRYTPAARDFQKLADAADVESGAGSVQDPLRNPGILHDLSIYFHMRSVWFADDILLKAKAGRFLDSLARTQSTGSLALAEDGSTTMVESDNGLPTNQGWDHVEQGQSQNEGHEPLENRRRSATSRFRE